MKPPSKYDVTAKLSSLIKEEISREEAADWAQQWVVEEVPPDMLIEVWDALKFLCAVDMISLDRPYLYEREDFEEELAKLI